MKAKRQILSLLLALVMVWQGFSFANAESSSGTAPLASEITNETAPSIGENTEETALSPSESTSEAELLTSNSTELEASDESGSIVPMEAALSTSLESTGNQIEDALTDIKLFINGDEHKPVQDGSTLASYLKTVKFEATILADKIRNVKEGDYISIELPKELTSQDTDFVIEGTDKNTQETKIMAHGKYIEATKEIRITFTKDAENYKGENGTFFFNTSVDTSVVKSSETKPLLEITVNGKTKYTRKNITYDIQEMDSEVSFYKDSAKNIVSFKDLKGNTHNLILYIVSLDMRHIEKKEGVEKYKDVVLTDSLQSNKLTYFDIRDYKEDLSEEQKKIYKPQFLKGIWRSGTEEGNTWKNAENDEEKRGKHWKLRSKGNNQLGDPEKGEFDFNYTDDSRRSFTYTLGDLDSDDGYYITYYAEINGGFADKDEFKNQAKLNGTGVSRDGNENKYIISNAGGSLNGSHFFNIKIQKTDEKGNPLQGAKFSITNPVNKYTETITSGENGIAELKDVSKADYKVQETEAPKGYTKDPTIYDITKENLEASKASGSTITLTIKNEKDEVKKKSTSFSVEKKWVVGENLATNKPDKVTVSVLKNGVKDDNLTVVLSQENGWKASFSNLPKEDANGQEIVYTVSEEELAGFKAAISGSDENKFTITNYNGGNVVIPVTKKWKGSGTHPDHVNVQLFANGAKVDSVKLNAGNNWQHNFEKPKYDANRKEIRYTVTEDNVSGYTLSKEDNPATGYVNVFVNTKNDVPPTSPNGGGNGGGGNGGGGNPPKPSPNTPGTPTEPTPGNVLGKNRDPESSPETVATVLSVDKTVPSVLGAGRGFVKTEDTSRMPIYLLFFALSACGLTATILYDRKRSKR